LLLKYIKYGNRGLSKRVDFGFYVEIWHKTGNYWHEHAVKECYNETISRFVITDRNNKKERKDVLNKKKIIFIALAAVTLASVLAVFLLIGGKQKMNNISLEKTSSRNAAITVSPGDEITYTLILSNSGDKARKLTVKDKIPENTSFVSGEVTCNNGSLSWTAEVPAGERALCSYTVKVKNDASLLDGGIISAPNAVVGKKEASCNPIYVATTLNSADRERLALGITVITYSEEVDPITQIKSMYSVAFSKTPALSGLPIDVIDGIFEFEGEVGKNYRDMVIPTFYGGADVEIPEGANFKGESAEISLSGLIVGDIIISRNKSEASLYVFDGINLLLVSDICQTVDAEQALAEISFSSAYAALRPSISMKTLYHYESVDNSDGELTDAQKALLATAKAYYLRGYRLQYDDTRMSASYESVNDRGEFRWQIGSYNPEDYTSEKWGYVNCAAFTYELYRNALGYDLGSLYTTAQLASHYANGGAAGVLMYPYQYVPGMNVDEETRAAVEKAFLEELEVGDLIVVRRNNGNGHVMMYVGNDTVIHSSGSSFNYNKDSETYEPTIRYMNIVGYLFEPTATNYIFRDDRYVTRLCIVRPLDKYEGTIPENTRLRMENLGDVLSEKLSSAPEGKTVNVGDDVTFTFRIKNVGKTEKTLTVTELIPSNSVLKSDGGATLSGDKLTWVVTVAAGETKDISYTVTAIGESGSLIESGESMVGGVLHTCPAVRIATTLTEAEEAAIKAAVNKFRENNSDNIVGAELVNAIYREAGLDAPFADENGEPISDSDLRASMMTGITEGVENGGTVWKLNEESEFSDMLIHGMYGGRRVFTPLRYSSSEKINSDRSRLPREQALSVGDVIVVKFSSGERMFMYIGDGILVNLSVVKLDYDTYSASTRLMRMMSAYHYYFILRPSMR